MKIFGKMEQQHRIDGHLIPSGAFYGRLNLRYTEKIKTGTRLIFDKQGYPVFRQDGTQVTRNVYKRVNKTVEVTYSLENLFPVSIGNTICFQAWYKVGRDGVWHDETPLNRNALTVELNNFLVRKVEEYCKALNCGLFDLCTGVSRPHLNKTRQVAQSAAHRREVQTDYLFKGYGLNNNTINEEVRFAPDGASIKGVFARHKDAFGVKAVNDPKKDAPEPLKHGFVCVNGKNSRVVYPTAKMAIAANHVYKHGKGDDAGTCLDADKIMAVRKI